MTPLRRVVRAVNGSPLVSQWFDVHFRYSLVSTRGGERHDSPTTYSAYTSTLTYYKDDTPKEHLVLEVALDRVSSRTEQSHVAEPELSLKLFKKPDRRSKEAPGERVEQDCWTTYDLNQKCHRVYRQDSPLDRTVTLTGNKGLKCLRIEQTGLYEFELAAALAGQPVQTFCTQSIRVASKTSKNPSQALQLQMPPRLSTFSFGSSTDQFSSPGSSEHSTNSPSQYSSPPVQPQHGTGERNAAASKASVTLVKLYA